MSEDPKAFLDEMCKGADPRKQRSLKLVYDVCAEQHDRGSKDYSIATIGRLVAVKGGPSTGAIRNKTGDAYRALIKAYADAVEGNSRKAAVRPTTLTETILEGVSDPILRTRVTLLIAELKSLRAQLLAARHLAKEKCVVELLRGEVRAAVCAGTGEEESRRPQLTSLELRSLKAAVLEQTWKHWGWHPDEHGRLLDERDRVVFGPGFVSGLRKVVTWLEGGAE